MTASQEDPRLCRRAHIERDQTGALKKRLSDGSVTFLGPGSNARFSSPDPEKFKTAIPSTKNFHRLSHDTSDSNSLETLGIALLLFLGAGTLAAPFNVCVIDRPLDGRGAWGVRLLDIERHEQFFSHAVMLIPKVALIADAIVRFYFLVFGVRHISANFFAVDRSTRVSRTVTGKQS